ncbi:ATP-dependent DNA ligase [Nocardioides daejeonensis]|uniref:ATP-dependent DNA ligase n=1 Tax=Nocardioides daejeonensis TaxID=1046556 RepID=UPI000D749BCD|nr:ATP-dependent DNA ligase [Nocardioides daejeonensis]
MRLEMVVEARKALRATRSRVAKREILADVLRAAGEETGLVAAYLAGELPQRRTGVGWSSLKELPQAAVTPSLTVVETDQALEEISELSGAGSATRRREQLRALFSRATGDEQQFLRDLILGELRQGASDAAVLDAIAEAHRIDPRLVRRAAMLGGSTPEVAVAAVHGGAAALEAFDLEVLRGVRPMLASSAPDVAAALATFGTEPVLVDAKLDGIRAQVHRRDTEVRILTRSLDDITARLPEVAERVLRLPGREFVLDAEVLLIAEDGRPRPFQETSARTASATDQARLRLFAFDLLAHDGEVLLDEPLARRRAALEGLLPAEERVRSLTTDDASEAQRFFDEVVGAGLEGVVVKDPAAPYAAGRRGAAWVKVKPRHTFDLVVVAVEWGSGRRRGLLSNIHLAARGEGGDLVMVGKTFKGMTDEMLAWQTERFLALETHREGHVVWVRPEQVVEIAIDGVQRSTRYPGGLALRFARVIRYRDDKRPDEADTIAALRHLGSS